jgi:hypothetical protein
VRVGAVGSTPTTTAGGSVSYPVTLTLGPGTGSGVVTPLAGMTGVVTIQVAAVRAAVAVPAAAVQSDGPASFVWRVEDGVAHRQPVVLGVQGDTLLQVVAGLAPGQQVVVSGAQSVQAGEQVGG